MDDQVKMITVVIWRNMAWHICGIFLALAEKRPVNNRPLAKAATYWNNTKKHAAKGASVAERMKNRYEEEMNIRLRCYYNELLKDIGLLWWAWVMDDWRKVLDSIWL